MLMKKDFEPSSIKAITIGEQADHVRKHYEERGTWRRAQCRVSCGGKNVKNGCWKFLEVLPLRIAS